MATCGIGRPLVPSEEGAKAFERMLLRQKRLVEANERLVMAKNLGLRPEMLDSEPETMQTCVFRHVRC